MAGTVSAESANVAVQTLYQWLADVEELARDVERWSNQNNWLVRRDTKSITEDKLGSYLVPYLTIRAPQGGMIFEPIARYVVGASGRVDLCAFPSFFNAVVVRTDSGWHIKSLDKDSVDRRWSEESFLETASQLMAMT